MKELICACGSTILVDDNAPLWIFDYKWNCISHAVKAGHSGKHTLARIIRPPLPGFVIDHINREIHDNRRSNLRFATEHQNAQNSSTQNNNTSGVKGVNLNQGKWLARINVAGKRKHLGRFNSKLAAATAYNEAAKLYYGEFAVLNNLLEIKE